MPRAAYKATYARALGARPPMTEAEPDAFCFFNQNGLTAPHAGQRLLYDR